jgi:hypothetical protein
VLVLENLEFGVMPIFTRKGSVAIEAFVQDDPDAPLVASAIVEVAADNLRSHVLRRSNNRSRETSSLLTIAPVQDSICCRTFVLGLLQSRRSGR